MANIDLNITIDSPDGKHWELTLWNKEFNKTTGGYGYKLANLSKKDVDVYKKGNIYDFAKLIKQKIKDGNDVI